MVDVKSLGLVAGTALFGLMQPVSALPLSNGDFSSGLANWNTSGDVIDAGGAAQLTTTTGTSVFSASLIQGDDGSLSFSTPLTLGAADNFLLFDVQFEDIGPDATEAIGPFSDALGVSLLDADLSHPDLVFSDVANLSAGTSQVLLDVSSLAGQDVGLYFDLTDENDGRDSRATIDNVVFTEFQPTSVPLPGTLLLLVAGLPLSRLACGKKRT